MIYTSIRAVPRWNHFSTPVLFPAVSIAGGALLAGQNGIAIPLLIIAGAWQLLVWHWGDQQFGKRGSTIKTATGLGGDGEVRLFEGPHTGTSYLTREMVYQVGRKHARNLRIIALLSMSILPAFLISFPIQGIWAAGLALILHLGGVFASRWLFFAEAEHVVGLYYQR